MVYTLEDNLTSLEEAMSFLDADLRQEAINYQIDSLESNMTRHLIDLSLGCKLIGCKLILKKKQKPEGTIDK